MGVKEGDECKAVPQAPALPASGARGTALGGSCPPPLQLPGYLARAQRGSLHPTGLLGAGGIPAVSRTRSAAGTQEGELVS